VHALHQALVQSLSEGQPALNRLLESAIRYVRTEHQKECEHPSHRKPSAAVAIFRCSSESIEYLVLGDASIVLESSEGVVHVTDQRMHRIAKDLRHTILDRLQQGRGYDDPVRTALLRDLVEQEQRARNTASDYPIAAYEPRAAFDSITESLPFSSSEPTIDRAILLSDGAERVVFPFGLCSDWREFMKLVSVQGPAVCIEMIRDAELFDRSGHQYPRTKFSDDASIVLWTSSNTWDLLPPQDPGDRLARCPGRRCVQ
jgi:hypothetical protein